VFPLDEREKGMEFQIIPEMFVSDVTVVEQFALTDVLWKGGRSNGADARERSFRAMFSRLPESRRESSLPRAAIFRCLTLPFSRYPSAILRYSMPLDFVILINMSASPLKRIQDGNIIQLKNINTI
jgi:hypothetical protein